MVLPTLSTDLVLQAQQRIAGYLHRTPLIHSRSLSDDLGTDVYLKVECFQKTGSFKPRGAFNKMLTLTPAQRAGGVVAFSGGNHAQGVAYAAQVLEMQATICMARSTPRNYVDATRGYGAEVVLCEDSTAALQTALQFQSAGRTYIPPFDDPLVAAGQGTVGLEILEELPGVTRLYVSIGGGGLIAGMATVMKAALPELKIFGVETRGAETMARSVAANSLITMTDLTSIARTLTANQVSAMTLHAVQQLVEEVLVVEDQVAVQSLIYLLERCKLLTEPAAACCLAAAELHRGQFAPGEKVVILLCGGNVALSDLIEYRSRFHIS